MSKILEYRKPSLIQNVHDSQLPQNWNKTEYISWMIMP